MVVESEFSDRLWLTFSLALVKANNNLNSNLAIQPTVPSQTFYTHKMWGWGYFYGSTNIGDKNKKKNGPHLFGVNTINSFVGQTYLRGQHFVG